MNEQFKAFQKLTIEVSNYLEFKLCFSPVTIDIYKNAWRRIMEYMISNRIKYYDKDTESSFLSHEFGNRIKRELPIHERVRYNAAKMLTQFQQTGYIGISVRPRKTPIVFTGLLGKTIIRFLEYKRIEQGLSITRLHFYERNLFLFFQYCNERNIRTIKDIDLTILLQYISDLEGIKPTQIYITISALRGFMKYLFDQQLLVVDYSAKIPRCKSVKQPKLPSTYSKEEIEKLLNSVERSSPMGKRNYAILLLASRLGLRASDIARLKFDNLCWQTSTLVIKQVKTGKELVLPILADVGNAIIDYLKYGRQASEEPYVFLTGRPPYGPFMTSNVVTHIVQRAFKKSGINIWGKKFGPHSLRHSLGFRMLKESTILPVISEVLGHKNTESTRYYLRIDLDSMQQCMLDVPAVAIDFYEQKGGIFYV